MLDTPNGVGHFLRQGDDSVQDTAVSSPNLFWDTELPRQRQVDVVCPNRTGNVGSVRIMARVYADRLFDGLLNEYKDTKKVIQICNQLIRIHEYKKTQYTLAAICLQFNLMNLDLPEPIWAIVGDEALVGPFAEEFLSFLKEAVHSSNQIAGMWCEEGRHASN